MLQFLEGPVTNGKAVALSTMVGGGAALSCGGSCTVLHSPFAPPLHLLLPRRRTPTLPTATRCSRSCCSSLSTLTKATARLWACTCTRPGAPCAEWPPAPLPRLDQPAQS